jgi:hypothetical protein
MNTEVMSAHFVPFRSPDFKSLPLQKESLQFAVDLWKGIFASWTPKLILTIDNKSFDEISRILESQTHAPRIDTRRFPTGWGSYEAEVLRLSGVREDGPVTIARLPHLSRFQLFGNPARASKLDAFLDHATQYLQPNRPCKG